MKRRYNMPFGSEYRDDGSVRFRLWAPAARQVDVCVADANRSMRLLWTNATAVGLKLSPMRLSQGVNIIFGLIVSVKSPTQPPGFNLGMFMGRAK